MTEGVLKYLYPGKQTPWVLADLPGYVTRLNADGHRETSPQHPSRCCQCGRESGWRCYRCIPGPLECLCPLQCECLPKGNPTVLAPLIKEQAAQIAALRAERDVALVILQTAPQPLALDCFFLREWMMTYRKWWIRRIPGTSQLIDAARTEVKP